MIRFAKLGAILAIGWTAQAQEPKAGFDPIKNAVGQFKDEAKGAAQGLSTGALAGATPAGTILQDLIGLKENKALWARMVAAIAGARENQQARTDLQKHAELFANQTSSQTTSTSENSGSTTVALKGGVAQILSLAVENGGLKRERDGSTVTFRGKPLAIFKTLQAKDFFEVLSSIRDDKAAEFWSRFSFAASFDTNRGGVQNTLLANSKQLVSWSIRAELVNQRDAAHRGYSSLWQSAARAHAQALLKADEELVDEAMQDPRFMAWHKKLLNAAEQADADWAKAEKGAKEAERAKIAAEEIDAFAVTLEREMRALDKDASALTGPKLASAATGAIKAWTALRQRVLKIEDVAKRGRLATLDFSTQRDDALPDLYTAAFIYENAPFRNKVHDLTFNVMGSWYRVEPRAPSTANRFKSFDAVAQYDIPLGDVGSFGEAIFSVAGKFQYVGASVIRADAAAGLMAGSAVTGGSATPAGPALPNLRALIPTVEGPLGLFQAKISFPVKGASARIPLAFTAATRSEAFQKPDYRAQIGLVFDLDSLFAKSSAQK